MAAAEAELLTCVGERGSARPFPLSPRSIRKSPPLLDVTGVSSPIGEEGGGGLAFNPAWVHALRSPARVLLSARGALSARSLERAASCLPTPPTPHREADLQDSGCSWRALSSPSGCLSLSLCPPRIRVLAPSLGFCRSWADGAMALQGWDGWGEVHAGCREPVFAASAARIAPLAPPSSFPACLEAVFRGVEGNWNVH